MTEITIWSEENEKLSERVWDLCEPTVIHLICVANDVARRYGHAPLTMKEEESLRQQHKSVCNGH